MARSNFPAALKELLIHEGGYVNHEFVRPFKLGLADKHCYGGECQTKTPSQTLSAPPSRLKAQSFTKRTPLKTHGGMRVLSADAPTKPTLKGCATRITYGSAVERTFPRRFADALTTLRAARVVNLSTVRVGGVCAPITIENCGGEPCARSVLTFSEAGASGAAGCTRLLLTISTTRIPRRKTSRCPLPSKARASTLLRTKSLSAPCCALTATG
jgi:hypothetical protein